MQNKSLDRKDGITLNVLSAVEADSKVTQRSLATDLGVALGLTNAYLKRCVDKGLVKINHVPRNRYLYYLTPQGFSEKARLTAEYLRSSLNFYRRARDECKEIIVRCEKKGIKNIILSIPTLVAKYIFSNEVPEVIINRKQKMAPAKVQPIIIILLSVRSEK